MKKLLVLAMVSAFVLTACGNDETTTEVPKENEVVETETETETETTVKGYVFETDGITIAIDMDMAEVVEALGEPASYFEAASCAFEGLDKTYTYGSYQITTYPQDEKDYISSILFKDDMVTTKEGVSLFMSEQDMIDAYGEDSTEINGATVYEKDGMRLAFIVENGEIVSIEYQSTVLD